MAKPGHGDLNRLVSRAARAAEHDATPVTAPAPPDGPAPRGRPDRRGRRGIVVYVDRGTHRRLRQIGLDEERTLQELMSEAIEMYLASPAREAEVRRRGAGRPPLTTRTAPPSAASGKAT